MTLSLFVRVLSGLTCPNTKKNTRWVFTVINTCVAKSRTSRTNDSGSSSLVEASSWSHHKVWLLVWKSPHSQCSKWFEGGNVGMATLILTVLFTAVNCWNAESAPLLCCSAQVFQTSVMATLILTVLFTAVNCWNAESAPLLCCSAQVFQTSVMGPLWRFGACVMREGEGNWMFGSTDLVVL